MSWGGHIEETEVQRRDTTGPNSHSKQTQGLTTRHPAFHFSAGWQLFQHLSPLTLRDFLQTKALVIASSGNPSPTSLEQVRYYICLRSQPFSFIAGSAFVITYRCVYVVSVFLTNTNTPGSKDPVQTLLDTYSLVNLLL